MQLTVETAKLVIVDILDGKTDSELRDEYEISGSQIYRLRNREIWRVAWDAIIPRPAETYIPFCCSKCRKNISIPSTMFHETYAGDDRCLECRAGKSFRDMVRPNEFIRLLETRVL